MLLKIRLFGIVRESLNTHLLELKLDGPILSDDLVGILKNKYEIFNKLSHFMLAVNETYCTENVAIQESDDLAIIPPVSGG